MFLFETEKEVTLDDLQNGYYIYQPKDGFRFGVDAVLLSSFVQVKSSEEVLDLGCGTGILPILLAAKTKGKHFTGLEIQADSVRLAAESIRYNHLEERVSVVEGDICAASALFGAERFQVCVSNPPYMISQHALPNQNKEKYIARHEAMCSFEDLAREVSKLLVSKGRFYLIHRPFRLAELITTLKKYHLEPKRLRLVQTLPEKEPALVLIGACKGGNTGLRVEPTLIINETPGVYTPEVQRIYNNSL